MDKLQLAKEILVESSKTYRVDNEESIKAIFNAVDMFYIEAQKRKYIPVEFCTKCNMPLKAIDLQGMYRVQCGCRKATGKTENEAMDNWIEND